MTKRCENLEKCANNFSKQIAELTESARKLRAERGKQIVRKGLCGIFETYVSIGNRLILLKMLWDSRIYLSLRSSSPCFWCYPYFAISSSHVSSTGLDNLLAPIRLPDPLCDRTWITRSKWSYHLDLHPLAETRIAPIRPMPWLNGNLSRPSPLPCSGERSETEAASVEPSHGYY